MRRAIHIKRAEQRMVDLAWQRAHARIDDDWPLEKRLTRKIETTRQKLAERGAG